MENQQNKPERLWSLPFVMLFCINIVTNFSFQMSQPVLSKYAVSLGASLSIAGTLAGIFAITALIIRPFSGFIADRFNKRNVLAVAVAVTSLAMMGHSISRAVPILFGFRILHGAAFGISSTVNIAMASMLIPRSRLGEGLSLFGIALIIARAISPNVGIFISNTIGLKYCFLAAGIIQAIAFILILCFPYTQEEKTIVPSKRPGFSIKSLIATESLIYAILGGCFTLLNGIMNSFLVLYADSLNIKGIGLYFTVNAGVVILCRLFIGKLIDRISIKYIVYPTLGAVILSVTCIAIARSIWLILLAAVFYGLGQGTGQPALQSTCIKQVGPERRGVATSTFYLGADVGQGIGPTIGGSISQYYGYSSMYALSTIPLVLGMLLFALHGRFKRKIPHEEPSKAEA